MASGRHVVLDLNGKTIDRNLTTETSGGYVIKVEGDLTITGGGTITGGCNQFDGGGVYVAKGGTFTMESGTISKNDGGSKSNGDGGGVYVAEGGTFTMKSGTISENTARFSGGGVYVAEGGTFTMENGTICKNEGKDNGSGGGVYVKKSTFIMNGGTISGNSVTNGSGSGGGVYVSIGTFNMTGGAISGNTAKSGGGVKVESYDDTSFNLSGKVDISGNTNGSDSCNVELGYSKVITVQDKLENTKPIGVTADKGVDFTSGFKTKMPDADPEEFFESDNPSWGVFWNSKKTEAIMAETVTVTLDNNITSDPKTKK